MAEIKFKAFVEDWTRNTSQHPDWAMKTAETHRKKDGDKWVTSSRSFRTIKAGYNDNNQPLTIEIADDDLLSAAVSSQLVDIFVRIPAQTIAFGKVLDGACATGFTDSMLTSSPIAGGGNAVREAVLLEICNAGIVVLPGAAGTVQEVFQDACENYYAEETSIAPMVLVGRTYWTDTYPAWPLLESLARGRAMQDHVHLVDTVDEARAVIRHG